MIIFDLCDTLYATNTTTGFLRYVAQTSGDHGIDRALRRWTDRSSPTFWVGALSHKLLGIDLARRKLIEALEGWTRDALQAHAELYAKTVLPRLANRSIHECLRMHQSRGDRVVIVSNSIDIVVAEVARQLGVEHEASRLEFHSGRCTGRLERDLTGCKSALLPELASEAPLRVYTDNRSDIDLLRAAKRGVVVLPGGSNKGRWAGPGYDYIEV